MKFEAAMRAFFEGYFSTNECRDKTRSAYFSDINQFSTFVGRRTHLRRITSWDIERWASHLKAEGCLPATIRRKIVVLKVFFGYWVRLGTIKESPFRRVKIQLGKIVQLPRTLNTNEIRKMLAHTQTGSPNVRARIEQLSQRGGDGQSLTRQFMIIRNAALLEVLFATGMRVGEVSAIDLRDFIQAESSFRVNGKGGRERLAYIVDKTTVRLVEEYISIREQLHVDTQAFFLNFRADRLSPQGIANVIRQIRLGCGIERHITPHMLRHTVATMLLRNGVDVRVVQEFLGHASITTTQRYTYVSKGHMIRELRNRHPSLTIRTTAS